MDRMSEVRINPSRSNGSEKTAVPQAPPIAPPSLHLSALPPLAPAPGRGQILDHEYVRNGVAEIFLEVEPLTGHRHVVITEHRTRKDWATFIKDMLDVRYPQALKVRLVMDNLNTHSAASLYEAFEPEEARR
ncbi:MAG: transposase, partial [candidate division NC10 bacterium]